MSHWRGQVGVGLAATLLASLLATSLVATTLAMTITNGNPSVTVPTGVATNVNLNYVWSGTAPTDTLTAGTTFAVTLPAGYGWTVLPTLTPSTGSMTFAVPVTVGQTTTWTLSAFTATGAWTLTLAGGTVLTANTSGSAPVTLSVGGGGAVIIATLTASGATGGSVVPVTVSPTSVPADGTSTIGIAFGTVTCTTQASFTVATTGGTFTTTNLPGVTSPVNGTSVTVLCASFSLVGGKTLTLQAPTTPGTATITVTVTPTIGSASVDSSTMVTFTQVAPGQGQTEREHGKGARKVAFYAGAGATTSGCAALPATPSAGAQSFGFAILNTTGHNRLNVTVSLKGATPNATYSVTVQQAPGTCSGAFNVYTNSRGNGNGHVHLALTSGATQAWVTAISGSNVLVTRLATLPVKGHGEKDPGNRDNKPNNGHGHEKD